MKLVSVVFTSLAIVFIAAIVYISITDIDIPQTVINKNIEPAEK